jgi:hypothetical protein
LEDIVPLGLQPSDAVIILDALGAAWTTFRLYPNPAGQPAFGRAVDALCSYADRTVTFEVGAGSFFFRGEELTGTRDGVERLAKELFVRDVEALRLQGAVSADDLCAFLSAATSEEQVDVAAALAAAGIEGLGVRTRGLLRERFTDQDDEGEEHLLGKAGLGEGDLSVGTVRRLSPVAQMVERGGSAEDVASQLLEDAEGDMVDVVDRFVDAYRELNATPLSEAPVTADLAVMMSPYWHDVDPSRLVRTFVEAFFLLPTDARVGVLNEFLDATDDGVHRLFLDQFSGTELAELAPMLDQARYGKLVEYARSVADSTEGHPEDVLPLLTGSRQVRQARRSAVDRVARLLDDAAGGAAVTSREDTAGAIRAALELESLGTDTLRELLECERRPDRFSRIMRIWVGKVTVLVRSGRFAEAVRWVDAVRDEPTYPPEQSLVVTDAMKRLLTTELLSILVELASQQEQSTEAVTLLSRLGPAVVDRLVDLLASEESPTLRRTLIDLLAEVGRGNVSTLVGHLKDPRWFVVRNLASVLGKTGHPKAVPPVRTLMRHDDHRVRLEALRALATLQRSKSTDDLLAALDDENQRVRLAALTLLRSSEADGVDVAMVTALETGSLGAEEARRLAEILVERGDPAARKALEELSSSRSFLSRSNRAAKQAAKDALKR